MRFGELPAEVVAAAGEVLARYSNLTLQDTSEPSSDPLTGVPRNPAAWLRWSEYQREPALRSWSEAMDRLHVHFRREGFEDIADLPEADDYSREPALFVPLCRRIVCEAAVGLSP